MKVVVLNTFEEVGGAAIACQRISKALSEKYEDCEVKNLVLFKTTQDRTTIGFYKNKLSKMFASLMFSLDRFFFLFYEREKQARFRFSPAKFGVDIMSHPLVKEADLIHIHWVNFGYLSLNGIQSILDSGKKVIWTFHDMWAFTGGCQFSYDCSFYKLDCGNCQYLKNAAKNDLSARILNKKRHWNLNNLTVVACSNWMLNKTKESSLMSAVKAYAIPNPIDVNVFQPLDKAKSQKNLNLEIGKTYLLFGAAKISDERKGFDLLVEALQYLKNHNIHVLLFGSDKDLELSSLKFDHTYLGNINNQSTLVNIYNAGVLLVQPSRYDNLPNTVMEAMSCGIPCVSFDTGGFRDLIDHRINGYLAKSFEVSDLAQGIAHCIDNADTLSIKARVKVEKAFSEAVVAEKYRAIYSESLSDQA